MFEGMVTSGQVQLYLPSPVVPSTPVATSARWTNAWLLPVMNWIVMSVHSPVVSRSHCISHACPTRSTTVLHGAVGVMIALAYLAERRATAELRTSVRDLLDDDVDVLNMAVE